MSHYLFAKKNYEKLGTVTDGEIAVDGAKFGSIDEWKTVYEEALGNILAATWHFHCQNNR